MTSVEAAVVAARSATSPAVERAIGLLLGAPVVVASAAVDRLLTEGRLGEGLATPALLLASRRGVEPAAAVARIVDGAPLPEDWSDYELRSAHAEAAQDVQGVLRAPSAAGDVVAMGSDAPLEVVGAVLEGRGARVLTGVAAAVVEDGLALPRALVDHAFCAELAGAAGWAVARREAGPAAAELEAALVAASGGQGAPTDIGWAIAPRWLEGLDEVVQTTPSRLRPPF